MRPLESFATGRKSNATGVSTRNRDARGIWSNGDVIYVGDQNDDNGHAHRFRHTFATWATAHDAREIDVQHLLGHSSPEMVRRYSATYGSAQAAERHAAFSPGDGMLVGALSAHPGGADGPPVSLRMP